MLTSSTLFKGLRSRVLMLSMVPLGLMIAIMAAVYFLLGASSDRLSIVVEHTVPAITTAKDIAIDAQAMPNDLWGMVIFKDDQDAYKDYKNQFLASLDRIAKDFDTYFKYQMTGKAEKLRNSAVDQWKELSPRLDELKDLVKADKTDEAKNYAAQLVLSRLSDLNDVLGKIEANNVDTMEAEKTQSAEMNRRGVMGRWVMVIGTFAAAFFSLFASIWYSGRIVKRLDDVSRVLEDATDEVTRTATGMAQSSSQLSQASSTQAASLEETVASIEELSSMVQQNAQNSQAAASLAETGTRSAAEGESEIRKLIEAMSDIAGSSKKIEEIINVIDDIAFQTNLLALNAAVEAARAGEHGKGFAVVAEAVRALAQRSSSAAKDINGMIKDSVSKTEHGSKIADRSGVVLQNIVDLVKKIAHINSEIAAASHQQSEGITQISEAMNQLNTVTQSNAATAEESTAASEALSAQTRPLQDAVGELNEIVQGEAKASDEDMTEEEAYEPAPKSYAPARPAPAPAKVIPFSPRPQGKGTEELQREPLVAKK